MKNHQRALIAALIANQLTWLPLAHAAAPADSAYATDHAKEITYVQDATSEGIGQLNSILCYIKSMGASQMVNEGDYAALVDEAQCDGDSRSDAGKSGSSNEGESAPQYSRNTVRAERDSDNDPMIVRAWVPVNAGSGGTPATVYARVSASEAPSTSNPYGVFRMDFCGKISGQSSCAFNGFIDASSAGIQYFERESMGPGQNDDRALQLTRDSATGTGQGALNNTPPVGVGKTFTFAYDSAYFRRADGATDQCFARDRNDPGVRESAWRYGLYDATTGARVDRNGGFPVKYTSGTSAYQGYVGYYGMHFPGGVAVPNGATVTKQNFSANDAGESYTLVKTDGKLTKFTKNSTSLDGIKNVRFNFSAFGADVPGVAGTQGKQLEAYWDGGKFVLTGETACGANGCKANSTGYPQDTSGTGWTTGYQGGMFGFSQSLGGEVFVNLSGTNPTSATQVFYRTQALVYPEDMAAIGTLHCLRDCPDADSLAAYDPNNFASSPFIGSTVNQFAPTSATISYTLDASTGALQRGGNAVIFDGEAGGQFRNGIRSGKLFPASNLAQVACGPGLPGQYCEHRANGLDTFYICETGPNSWNQFTGLKDGSGNFLKFDAPLQVAFSVPDDAAKYGTNAASQIILQYNGFGSLFGIPGQCFSQDNNQPVSCNSNSGKVRYVPAFSIPFDETLGRVTLSGGPDYLVGSLEREIRLARKTLGTCTGRSALATLPNASGLPTASGLKNPSDPADASYIGEPPTVTASPRVVQGVKKY